MVGKQLGLTFYIRHAILALIYYFTRNYHQRLKEKNKRKIEQLEIAKEKELYEAKIEFFTNVAHEIKTPLTLIKGPLEKVIKKAGDIPEIKDSLRIMEKNTEPPGRSYQSITRFPSNRDQRIQPQFHERKYYRIN